MLVRKIVMGAVLAVLLALVWKYFVSARLGHLVPERMAPAAITQDVLQAKELITSAAGSTAAGPGEAKLDMSQAESLPKAPAGIHKCKVGNTVTYTDEPCKSRAAERPLDKGSVTVVKSQGVEAPAATESKGRLPNVRDLAGPQGEPSIMDRQIERAVNH
ncbi:MAG: hypothetical protein EPO09_00135 [Aquabacterium sp.]|uniref:hypothetical protein n=1 Tax=Aquabacterium sp. TaxID=1872578 RepID=UPI001218BCAF|nr:hypothetical protein [Aquabacterium sp.]TAL00120.1 MAG: hypothetical protein EPO09_00135 [Aquabacterium sp.]